MDLNDLNKVWEVKPLKKIGEDDARKVLENIAKQVQPIMRKHKWKVKILSEFCPANPSLLGLNIGGGAEIKLRLRRPNKEWDFLPWSQILDTMLHELCHNEHGPHNTDFYNLLDEIRKFIGLSSTHTSRVLLPECEDLMAKGIMGTGLGFDLPGRRLGGFTHNPPLSSMRQNSQAAAENRARNKALFPSGSKRIGGDSNIMSALSPKQAAAMAAERRLYDDLWCGSKFLESNTDDQGKIGSSIGSSGRSEASVLPDKKFIRTSSSLMSGQVTVNDQATWQCTTCTLLNQPHKLICEACGTQKHKEIAKFKGWSCKFCTLDNKNDLERCLACGEWRYSYGSPVYTPGPYLGT